MCHIGDTCEQICLEAPANLHRLDLMLQSQHLAAVMCVPSSLIPQLLASASHLRLFTVEASCSKQPYTVNMS